MKITVGDKQYFKGIGKIKFEGKEYHTHYTRSGLDGMSVVIAVDKEDGRFDLWELYTDIPARPDVTAEQIKENARKTLERYRR